MAGALLNLRRSKVALQRIARELPGRKRPPMPLKSAQPGLERPRQLRQVPGPADLGARRLRRAGSGHRPDQLAARSACRSSFSASAIRNASSRLCWALRRGSQ